jgi:hypothetical protein
MRSVYQTERPFSNLASGPKIGVHFTTVDLSKFQVSYTPKDSSGASSIVITSSGSIETDFMRVIPGGQFNTLGFSTSSTSKCGQSRMRVALVLDVTGSMAQDNKMPNLQSAATSMIDTLSNLNKTDGDVYISVIPFSRDTNVGSNNTTYIEWSN